MSIRIQVTLPQNPYDILIASSSLSQLGNYLRPLQLGKKVLLVSNDDKSLAHYRKIIVESLQEAEFDVAIHLIPAGETYKTLKFLAQVYDTALLNHLERSSTMIALGGGVVGDMTGFAAATWLRGINFIQVPTSLLAMVDASIGGKTGVNHPKGKNLIGAFYQPRLVLIDPLVLETLPVREFRAGMAEVIKYGVIRDAELFTQLEQADKLDKFSAISETLLQTIITSSCKAKADVVSKDERESGLRAILNYGHTIAHALESLTGYSTINHGEAVAIGMVAAGRIATKMQKWTQTEANRQEALIKKTSLPMAIPANLDSDEVIEELKKDKKVKNGKVRFVLPTRIGNAIMLEDKDQVPSDLVRDVLEELKES